MLHEDFESVLQAKTREEFGNESRRFTSRLGFNLFGTMVVVDHVDRESDFLAINDCPPEAIVPAYGRIDPVMQHCKYSRLPIVWNQDTYVATGLGWLWEWQASFGPHTGMALALHLPQGKHFFFSVDRDQPLPKDSREVARMTADLSLFVVYAQDTALRVFLTPESEVDAPKLTCRELESLKWTMEGKTAWEVGRILSISEQTVVRHVNNATHKLGCVNKHHAVVKALRLGLIR